MSVRFNGTDNYLTVGTPFDYNAAYTVMVTVYVVAKAVPGAFFGPFGDGNNNEELVLPTADNFPQHYVKSGGSFLINGSLGSGSIATGGWHNVVWRRDSATQISTFIDGVVYGNALTHTTVAARTAATLFVIGQNSGDLMNCRMHSVKVWTAALTQAEIDAEQTSMSPRKFTNLWAWYPMLQIGDIADYSGNGRNLTVNGTTPVTEDNAPISWGAPTWIDYAYIPVAASMALLAAGACWDSGQLAFQAGTSPTAPPSAGVLAFVTPQQVQGRGDIVGPFLVGRNLEDR